MIIGTALPILGLIFLANIPWYIGNIRKNMPYPDWMWSINVIVVLLYVYIVKH